MTGGVEGAASGWKRKDPGMAELSREEQEQREHFNQWQNVYEEHYDDKYSAQLRERFYLEPALRGVDLKGRRALEAMCGSGQSTGFLLERGAEVTGVDISQAMMGAFARRWPGSQAVTASVLETGCRRAASTSCSSWAACTTSIPM
jgi:SAM-dependent methyltransferase